MALHSEFLFSISRVSEEEGMDERYGEKKRHKERNEQSKVAEIRILKGTRQ